MLISTLTRVTRTRENGRQGSQSVSQPSKHTTAAGVVRCGCGRPPFRACRSRAELTLRMGKYMCVMWSVGWNWLVCLFEFPECSYDMTHHTKEFNFLSRKLNQSEICGDPPVSLTVVTVCMCGGGMNVRAKESHPFLTAFQGFGSRARSPLRPSSLYSKSCRTAVMRACTFEILLRKPWKKAPKKLATTDWSAKVNDTQLI